MAFPTKCSHHGLYIIFNIDARGFKVCAQKVYGQGIEGKSWAPGTR
uniref:Uncharacterized protein n=1 Tax=Lotus japonicus TaxID=34305 RepID=I3SUF7_LOTJA|nr:unknown [Lotus japonicus]